MPGGSASAAVTSWTGPIPTRVAGSRGWWETRPQLRRRACWRLCGGAGHSTPASASRRVWACLQQQLVLLSQIPWLRPGERSRSDFFEDLYVQVRVSTERRDPDRDRRREDRRRSGVLGVDDDNEDARKGSAYRHQADES